MKLTTVTASYVALSFGSFFGHITDREMEHCKGMSNLSEKDEAEYVRGRPGFYNVKGLPEVMPLQLFQHQTVDYLFVLQYFRSAPASASVVDKLV